MSTWKHEYLERAQHIIAMRNSISSPDVTLAECQLEDDIQGKLSIEQAGDLLAFVFDIPSQAAMLISSMIPLDVANFMRED